LLEVPQVLKRIKNLRYIAEISTGHQRNGMDEITGFLSL